MRKLEFYKLKTSTVKEIYIYSTYNESKQTSLNCKNDAL